MAKKYVIIPLDIEITSTTPKKTVIIPLDIGGTCIPPKKTVFVAHPNSQHGGLRKSHKKY
jgi:hypothetical protein